MLNDLFNELRALTKKHENTRPLVESTEQEIIAYKHLVRELLNSSSLSLQEANKKLIAVTSPSMTV